MGVYCNTVVTYAYDAWGKLLSTTGSLASTVGAVNPFLYRGYYYDSETSLYYLNSRYYDPQIGRFISEDSAVSTGIGFLEHNMFAYCNNNSVRMIDTDGLRPLATDSLATETAEERAISYAVMNHKITVSKNSNILYSKKQTARPDSGLQACHLYAPICYILPYSERIVYMLSSKIRQYRIRCNMSESELARRNGHAVSTIHGIENGDNKNPGFKIIYDLSRVLNVSLDELGRELFEPK